MKLLAVDLGTQSLRATVCDPAGQRLWAWSAPVDSHIDGDVFEQSPAQWQALLDEALAALGAEAIAPDAAAVAAPLAGYVALDDSGRALTPAATYADRRTQSWIGQVEAALSASPGANPLGLRSYVPDPLAHFLRLRDAAPGVYARTHRLLDATAWINRYLTGASRLNEYTALRLYTRDVRQRLGVPEDFFGRPIRIGERIGYLRDDLCTRFGLPPFPVIAATFDSKCAYFGSAIASPGDGLDISGTVTSLGVVCAHRVHDALRRVYSVPFAGETHLARGSTASSGGVLEWARAQLLHADFDEIDRRIRTTRARDDAPIFLPYLAGERTPLWNPHARGALLGLTLDASSAAQLARSIYEGLAHSARHILDTLSQCGVPVRRLDLCGGLARNDTLCQIKADVLGLTLRRYRDVELTSTGLLMIAGLAIGAWPDRAHAQRALLSVDRVFEPDPDEHRVHDRNFARYLEYSRALSPTFRAATPTAW